MTSQALSPIEILLDVSVETKTKTLLRYTVKKFKNNSVKFFSQEFENVDHASENWIKSQKKIKERNKVLFLKTHSCLGAFKGKPFTTPDYTLGGIYVVRDPRNVITSVKNHFSFDEDEAYNFMSNINTSIKKKIHQTTELGFC